MATVAVVGAGQIGSRHLQALARSPRIDRVEVVGRSAHSLKVAEERYRAVGPGDRQSVLFSHAISDLSEAIDLAIVATNADTRFAVVNELVCTKRVRALILEKVVFQAPRDFELTIGELAARGIPAWVNCFRRALPFYAGLRELFAGEQALSLTVEGGQWGLGCNAVHYADLCAFVTGTDDFDIDEHSQLDPALLASRRPGFVEFTGRVRGTCGVGHRFQLVARAGSDESATVCIEGRNRAITIDEIGKKATLRSGDTLEPPSVCSFELPLQSELTHTLVEEILERGWSSLPTLEQSYATHAPLLKLFTSHLERVTGTRYARCPIT